MRKILILFFILSTNFIYGQSHSPDIRIIIPEDGYLYLNSFIPNFTSTTIPYFRSQENSYMFSVLSDLNKANLRLVRNAIYAKHGYKFNSIDLHEYFSQYDWYKGTKTNVDSELTEDEKIVIAFIKQLEGNYPSKVPEELIGLWFELPDKDWWTLNIYDFYAFNAAKFRFYPNGLFYYMDRDFTEYYGFWSLEENKFKLSFSFLAKNERNYFVFDPNKHHNRHTTNFEENIIFFNKRNNKRFTVWEEFMWECNFQKNERSWKKVYPDPDFIAGDRD